MERVADVEDAQNMQSGTASGADAALLPEGRLARVRRLLIDPLEGLGFRRKAGVGLDDHRAVMDRLAENVAYLSDDSLRALGEMLRTKGEGAQRNIWPAPATVYALAELIQRRPIEELPGCLRWFRSVEGPRAKAAGTLVETWQFFHRHKRPPLHMGRELAAQAADNRRRLTVTDERAAVGRAAPEDVEWCAWYRRQLAHCEALVAGSGAADEVAA
jgi:hypothetical protein